MQQTQKTYIFDSNLLVDFQRGKNTGARDWITKVYSGSVNAGISIITEFELWVGVRNGEEAKRHKLLLSRFKRFQLNVTIARRAADLYRPFGKDQNRYNYIPDLIIAATAEYYKADLVTSNVKHFQNLPLNNVNIIQARKNS